MAVVIKVIRTSENHISSSVVHIPNGLLNWWIRNLNCRDLELQIPV